MKFLLQILPVWFWINGAVRTRVIVDCAERERVSEMFRRCCYKINIRLCSHYIKMLNYSVSIKNRSGFSRPLKHQLFKVFMFSCRFSVLVSVNLSSLLCDTDEILTFSFSLCRCVLTNKYFHCYRTSSYASIGSLVFLLIAITEMKFHFTFHHSTSSYFFLSHSLFSSVK